MTLDEIRELIKLVTETGVAELELQRGEDRVRIRRSNEISTQEYVVAPAGKHVPAQTSPVSNDHSTGTSTARAESQAEVSLDESLILVKSPIVGTFYEAPSPGAPPFVKPGDTVSPGQVLCIIESMKLMNEIEAEVAGVVVSKLVENAQPVEYGEALFSIRPL
jgi:acetyl-CoA carboxylase biotin carboxyl carrier protein